MNRILLADDNDQNLYLLGTLLQGYGYEVSLARNGSQALKLAGENPPDLIITDIMMPVMDGFELCRQWKANERLRQIPFVFYTATYTDPKDEQFALDLGAERFVMKPQKPEILGKIVKEVLEKVRQQERVAGSKPATGEKALLKQYNEILFHKLEQKIVQLENEIAARVRSEEELKSSEERFRSLFEHSPVGKSLTLFDGTIQVNKSFCEMLGYTAEELMKMKWQDITHHDDIRKSNEAVAAMLAGRYYHTRFEKRYIRKNGETVWADVSTFLQRDNHDNPQYFITAINDITQRKKSEEEIKTLNSQLENRVRERTLQFEIANRELEAFAYSISHDLRAPLRAIDGFSAILAGEYTSVLDDEAKRLCSVIRENTRKMGQLIDDLLAFSRAGRASMGKTTIDMNMVVRTVFMDIVTPQAAGRIDFMVNDLPQAMGDLPMFRQVWINLLGNAIKFSSMKERAKITVSGEETESEIVYSVEDNGAGFDMRYYDRLFGVFERLHTTAEFPGTGVGLAIVKRIISRHGGRIWAASDIGKGATFYFSIPREGRDNTDTNNGGNYE